MIAKGTASDRRFLPFARRRAACATSPSRFGLSSAFFRVNPRQEPFFRFARRSWHGRWVRNIRNQVALMHGPVPARRTATRNPIPVGSRPSGAAAAVAPARSQGSRPEPDSGPSFPTIRGEVRTFRMTCATRPGEDSLRFGSQRVFDRLAAVGNAGSLRIFHAGSPTLAVVQP